MFTCFLRLPFAYYDMFFVRIYAVCYEAISVFIHSFSYGSETYKYKNNNKT